MTIDEICKRLGLKNREELASMLDFGNRDYTLERLKLGARLNPDEVQNVLICGNELNEYVSKTDKIDERIQFKREGWGCVLKGKIFNSKKTNLNLTVELPKMNPMKQSGQLFFQSGHILGKQFYYFLENKKNAEIKIKSKSNGFVQFSVANMEQLEGYGLRQSQAYFENKICDYLRTGGKIFYEVKVIYIIKKGKKSKYPIGTQLLFKTLECNQSNIPLEKYTDNHVFIPNFDVDFILPSVDCDLEYLKYQEFYFGELEDELIEDYFNNSYIIPNISFNNLNLDRDKIIPCIQQFFENNDIDVYVDNKFKSIDRYRKRCYIEWQGKSVYFDVHFKDNGKTTLSPYSNQIPEFSSSRRYLCYYICERCRK